jgi:hypothetical protein
MKSVRKFHAAFVPDGRVLVSHIPEMRKKYMETQGSPRERARESITESLYARPMEVWRDTPVGAPAHICAFYAWR